MQRARRIILNRSYYSFLIACVATGALSAAACVPAELELDSLTLEVGETCPSWDCGANGPVINGFPVDELNLAGAPSSSGFVIIQFISADAMFLTLDVQGGEFRGLDGQGDTVVDGASVVGSTIMVHDGTRFWEIEIAGYTSALEDWVEPAGFVSAYHLRYRPRGRTEWIDMCKDPRSAAADPNWPNGHETYALLVEGERYDPVAKTVQAADVSDEDWFNIACAGSALSKMVLMRYDPRIAPGSVYHTTPQERQATLKMLTADYCGTGRSFTVSGHPLLWENDAGSHMIEAGDVDTLEAVWDENGATCLSTPRLLAKEPGILADIQTECALPPPCTDPDPGWAGSGEWRTHNPL
jgi:hypothetical protein